MLETEQNSDNRYKLGFWFKVKEDSSFQPQE